MNYDEGTTAQDKTSQESIRQDDNTRASSAAKEKRKSKHFYSIAEVAEEFGVAESLLRFWEKQFPNIHPKKAGNNVRQYTAEDIEEVRVVYNLVKVRGMKLNAAKDVLSKNKKGAGDISLIINELRSLREDLVNLRKELSEL